MRTNRITPAIPIAMLAIVLTACAAPAPNDEASEPDPAATTELDAPAPRLAVLRDDEGVTVLDAATLEVVAEVATEGATRIAEAGDGRHVVLTREDGFAVLDGGAWTEAHGDHGHSFATEPVLTDLEFPMSKPGHVVHHEGRTALFSDGDGTVTLFDTAELADGEVQSEVIQLEAPHHGVAVPISDDAFVVTAGTEESRSSIRAITASGAVLASTDACPDVHGETVAAEDVLVFGCTGSVTVFENLGFRSIPTPDADAGIGGPKGSSESDVVLADYAIEGETETDRVALIDLGTDTMTVVELPAPYYYWSLARGPHGEALVLGTDGSVHILDPETGSLIASVPVIEEWTPPEDWRDPAPSITVLEHTAYVTDPEGSAVHAVDLDELAVTGSVELDATPMSAVPIRG